MGTRLTKAVAKPAAALLLGLLVSCTAGGSRPSGVVQGDALEMGRGSVRAEAANTLDIVVVAGMEKYFALRSVVLVSARPHQIPKEVKVLATRVVFSGSKRHVETRGVGVVAVCAPWPPAGFGPTYDVAGLKIDAGDNFFVMFFLKATQPGPHIVRGVDIEYRDDGGLMRQESTKTTVDMLRTRTKAELPDRGIRACSPELYERLFFFQPFDWTQRRLPPLREMLRMDPPRG